MGFITFMTFNHLINYIKCKDPMTMKGLILISNNNSYVYPILIYLPKFTQCQNLIYSLFLHVLCDYVLPYLAWDISAMGGSYFSQ